jgi:hypothetical protein
MPCRWADAGLPGFAGRVRFTRRFGYPGQIDVFERVWLVFAGVEGTAEVALNGVALGRHDGADGPFEHEVTALLRERNVLVVEVEELTGRGGLWGEVALEIRRTAYLRGVRFDAAGTALRAAGAVVGSSERPLELYLLLGNRSAGYAVIEPAPEGRPFLLSSGPLEPERLSAGQHTARVELVDAATVWHFVEQSFAFPPAAPPTTAD